MDIHKLRKILQRYSKGKANETESALIEAWYKSYAVNELPVHDDGDVKVLRESIQRSIKAATSKQSIFHLPVFRIAVALAICSTSTFLIWKFTRKQAPAEYTIISTGTNGLKEITLSDGSVVWLNAASRLKAPVKFTGDFREVILEEGEAFFTVKKDHEHPFIVHTAPLKVQVLGTSFNIKAYRKLNSIKVSVSTGKVGVSGRQKTLAMLTPGQQLSYNLSNGITEVIKVDIDLTKSWKQGFTYLNQADFKELSITVKNIYGLLLKPGNKEIEKYRFSLRLIHRLPSAQILELISQLHHTQFKKEGNELILY